MTLVEFLTARYDEAEKRERSHRTFKGWPPRDPCPECGRPVADVEVRQSHDDAEVEFAPCGDVMAGDEFFKRYAEDAADPFVLADIDSKRRIMDRHSACDDTSFGEPCEDLRDLALPYADHPEFKEKWRV